MRQQLRLRVLIPIAVVALLGLGVGAMAFTGTPAEEPIPDPLPRAAGGSAKKAEEKPSPEAVAGAERLARNNWRKQANDICTGLNESVARLGEPQKPEDIVQLLPESIALAEAALTRLVALQPANGDAAEVKRMLAELRFFVGLEKRASEALANQDVELFVDLNARAFRHNDRGSAIALRLGVKACAAGATAGSALERALERQRVVVAVFYTPDSTLDRLLVREARAGAEDARVGFVAVTPTDTRSGALLAKRYGVRAAPAVLVFVRWRGAVATFTEFVDRDTIAQAAESASL
jgi:hypothetical protein